MHSSRMRTARSLTASRCIRQEGRACPGVGRHVCMGGVCAWGCACLGRGGGACVPGGNGGRCACPGGVRATHAPL